MIRKEDLGRAAFAATLLIAGTHTAGTAHAQAAAQADQSQDNASGQLEEVVVTAQRREETVQRSSLAIDVVAATELETGGVTQAMDLANVVPGLTVSQGGATVQTYLRGVGSFATDASAESSIAYNINSVYISRPNAIGPIFFDLARVEVLKGPQGTLYGRNASGGAINLITNRPTQEFEGRLSLEAGNFDHLQGTGVLNVPAGDTLAFRAAGQIVDREGYLSDGYDDQDTKAGRLLALWNPSETMSLLVTGEYAQIGGKGAGVVRRSSLQPVASDPWTGPSEPISQPPTAFIPNGTRVLDDGNTDVESRGLSAEFNWELPFATLTFIPAVRNVDIAYLTYTPAFRFDTTETSEQTSYELRLGNASERLNWVGGLFYFDEDQTEVYFLNANPIQQSNVDVDLNNESWAAFGQATFSVNDTLRLIGGVRYTEEDKEQSGQTIATLPVAAVTNNAGQRSFDDVSWKAGVEYDVAPDSMLFFTAATGFKAGGFFPSVQAPNNSYDPEELLAYTLGLRNRFLDRRLQVNVETFY
jgi:iron complex outermembrane recepter protein